LCAQKLGVSDLKLRLTTVASAFEHGVIQLEPNIDLGGNIGGKTPALEFFSNISRYLS
jgi:hypothetical protein